MSVHPPPPESKNHQNQKKSCDPSTPCSQTPAMLRQGGKSNHCHNLQPVLYNQPHLDHKYLPNSLSSHFGLFFYVVGGQLHTLGNSAASEVPGQQLHQHGEAPACRKLPGPIPLVAGRCPRDRFSPREASFLRPGGRGSWRCPPT